MRKRGIKIFVYFWIFCIFIFLGLTLCKYFKSTSTPPFLPVKKESSAIKNAAGLSVVWDICSGSPSTCFQNSSFAFVYFITNINADVRGSQEGSNRDESSYFDYAIKAIRRTTSLTNHPILVLVTKESKIENPQRVELLVNISPQVEVKEVDERVWMDPFVKYGVVQKRQKLMHAYGTTQVFNPEYVGKYERLVFLDVDTFLVRNVDELFCSTGFAAAKRKGVDLFNGGVFVYRPSRVLYTKILDNMLQYMREPGVKKFAMQELLHRTFGNKFFCLSTEYNCGGFCTADSGCSQISPKCDVTDEIELFKRGAIIHSKIGEPHLRSVYPTLYQVWLSFS